MKDFRNASSRSKTANEESSLPQATNALDAVADDAAAAVEGAAAAARSAAASVREWVTGANRGEGGELPPAPVRGVGGGGGGGAGDFFQVKGEARPRQQQPASSTPRYRRGPPSSSDAGISPAASSAITSGLALLAAAAVVAAVARRVSTGSWGSQRKRGRWVRDRSLGGKMIFVEDDSPLAASQLRRSMNADLFSDRDGEGKGAEEDPSDVAAAARAAAAGGSASRSATATAKQQKQLPSWWSPPRASSRSSLSPAALAQAMREDPTLLAAAATLRQLEDSKVSGRDYSISALVSIRSALGDSGVSLKPRTGSQRDAMFRAAAAAAAEEACSPSFSSFSSPLGGIPANEFVSGCASDLGVPTDEAVNMSCAAVAAKARGLLVDALASRRGGDFTEALLLVGRLAALLSALPLVEGGPQAPMVATALSQRAT